MVIDIGVWVIAPNCRNLAALRPVILGVRDSKLSQRPKKNPHDPRCCITSERYRLSVAGFIEPIQVMHGNLVCQSRLPTRCTRDE